MSRKTLKQFRALLFQIECDGFGGKSWQGRTENLRQVIEGYANFIYMVNGEKGQVFKAQVKRLLKKIDRI